MVAWDGTEAVSHFLLQDKQVFILGPDNMNVYLKSLQYHLLIDAKFPIR